MRPGLGGVWLWDGGVPGVGPDTILILQRTKWKCDAVLRGEPGHPWGRFGAALTVLGDVNGDRLADVAIGAPGEQENRGAVYLFHGTSELGISPSHSQVRLGHSPFCHKTSSWHLSVFDTATWKILLSLILPLLPRTGHLVGIRQNLWSFRNGNIGYSLICIDGFLVAQMVKNLPAMQETWV